MEIKIGPNMFKFLIALIVAAFGAYCVSQGHNGVVMGSVFAILGFLAGVKADILIDKIKS